MHLDADARLAAAAGGAVRYFADAAGLEHESIADLQDAVIAACEEAFQEMRSDSACVDVTLTWRVDRIEVAVSHRRGNYSSSNAPADLIKRERKAFDDVQHERGEALIITRLTKFIRQGAART